MADPLIVENSLEALRKLGDVRRNTRWADGDPDYVAEYHLTPEHIPALIALATTWVDGSPEDTSVYAQVHAWRALGQLRAVEAVQPLLDVQDELDRLGDDWYLEEFHHVFGLIGPPAIPRLAAYLADRSHGQFPRGKAAAGLREIARRYPETREEIVDLLACELARHQKDAPDLNGSLVHELLELHATIAAGVIERAFAANVVDPTVAGDWGDVRQELGVVGLGLAPDRSPGWPTLLERIGFYGRIDEPPPSPSDRHLRSTAKREARAKRKAERKNRKRNRKPR